MLIAFVLSLAFGAPAAVTGVVRDTSGAAVAGATVLVRAGVVTEQAVTHDDGRFDIGVSAAGDVVVTVRAPGFADRQVRIPAGGPLDGLEIVLSPARITESLTVTPTRTEQRLGDVPASVTVLSGDDIALSPAVVADDVLRQLPEFSLFRRVSSLSAHPTAQGVSLRGIGPSGVSRTLVLVDGLPFNDPFGGWVYWSRVPLAGTERVEVVDGASSSLYGNYAMGGVINILTARPAPRFLETSLRYGNLASPKADFIASGVRGRLGAVIDATAFSTGGYPIVAPGERGLVDRRANDRFGSVNLKLEYRAGDAVTLFARSGYFRERRDNGKASTIDGAAEANSTRWTTLAGGADLLLPDAGTLQLRAFGDVETFRSNFLAVPAASPPRSVGRMTLDQSVPVHAAGGSAQWARTIGRAHLLTAGVDLRRVDGDSREDALDAVTGQRIVTRRVSGGTQTSAGLFVQDLVTPAPKLVITIGARVDRWRNHDGHNLETNVATGQLTAGHAPLLAGRSDTAISPRAGVMYHVTDRVSAWGNLGWGFRAPTLNELYRQFRVGTVLTLANHQLGRERLLGGEAGLNVALARGLTWRATWFANRVANPVSNVTVAVAGSQITRQRRNLGATRVSGLQTDLEYRAGPFVRVSGGYVFDRARVSAFDADPALVGNVLPQVPTHRATARLLFTHPRYLTAALQAQFAGRQFDDDQNRFVLPRYALIDLRVSRAITRGLDLFAGVQNLLDRQVVAGRNPTTIGAPRMVSAGVRVQFAR